MRLLRDSSFSTQAEKPRPKKLGYGEEIRMGDNRHTLLLRHVDAALNSLRSPSHIRHPLDLWTSALRKKKPKGRGEEEGQSHYPRNPSSISAIDFSSPPDFLGAATTAFYDPTYRRPPVDLDQNSQFDYYFSPPTSSKSSSVSSFHKRSGTTSDWLSASPINYFQQAACHGAAYVSQNSNAADAAIMARTLPEKEFTVPMRSATLSDTRKEAGPRKYLRGKLCHPCDDGSQGRCARYCPRVIVAKVEECKELCDHQETHIDALEIEIISASSDESGLEEENFSYPSTDSDRQPKLSSPGRVTPATAGFDDIFGDHNRGFPAPTAQSSALVAAQRGSTVITPAGASLSSSPDQVGGSRFLKSESVPSSSNATNHRQTSEQVPSRGSTVITLPSFVGPQSTTLIGLRPPSTLSDARPQQTVIRQRSLFREMAEGQSSLPIYYSPGFNFDVGQSTDTTRQHVVPSKCPTVPVEQTNKSKFLQPAVPELIFTDKAEDRRAHCTTKGNPHVAPPLGPKAPGEKEGNLERGRLPAQQQRADNNRKRSSSVRRLRDVSVKPGRPQTPRRANRQPVSDGEPNPLPLPATSQSRGRHRLPQGAKDSKRLKRLKSAEEFEASHWAQDDVATSYRVYGSRRNVPTPVPDRRVEHARAQARKQAALAIIFAKRPPPPGRPWGV